MNKNLFKASRKSIRKNSSNISLKPLQLTLNNLCSRDILQRLSQLGDNYIANTKTQSNKRLFEINVKNLEQIRTKLFLNLSPEVEQFIPKVFLGISLKMLLLGSNNDYIAIAKTQAIKIRSKSKVKNIRRTSRGIILKSLLLLCTQTFFVVAHC